MTCKKDRPWPAVTHYLPNVFIVTEEKFEKTCACNISTRDFGNKKQLCWSLESDVWSVRYSNMCSFATNKCI